MKDKIIGIIGGMGPEATAGLFLKIIKATPVEKDQDHFRVIIDSNPKIPDRTTAILGNGPSPLEAMIETGRNLEKLGVSVAGIPCITAHFYIEELQKALSYKILNALQELQKIISSELPGIEKIGVLSTTGTMKTRLFDRYFPEHKILYPSAHTQETKVMEAIYGKCGIKKGFLGEYPTNLLIEAGQELVEKGAGALIAGCTEIPLVLRQEHFCVPLFDPMEALARALITYPVE